MCIQSSCTVVYNLALDRVAAPYETASNKFVDFLPLPHKSPQYSIFILLILYMVISINQYLYINYDMSFSALLSLRR